MRAGRVERGRGARASIVALIVLLAPGAHAAEVRVLSGPGSASTITVAAEPGVAVEDRTPGASPTTARQGPASRGQTFTGEITLWLSGFVVPRAAAVDVNDPVVSTVRLFPERGGTLVTIFVRQPVTYAVSRPSPIGSIRVEVRGRTRGLVVTPGKPGEPPRLARPPSPEDPEVNVDAESLAYDQQGDVLTARGGVTLTRGDTTLTADEIVYDRARGLVDAQGHVVLTDPDATVEGDRAHLDLNEETGWVESATGMLPRNRFLLEAGRVDKEGGARYAIRDGVFTTCECGGLERPSWSIAGGRTDVRVGGAGVVRGLTLRVKDVPVLWVPYFIFPANTDRQSGFLLPRTGYSNRRGFVYEQPFYWAINKSSDATVAAAVETSARIGVIGEYRYAISRRTQGQFTGAYFNERIRGRTRGTLEPGLEEADIPEHRFAFAGRHSQPFYGRSRFFLDLFAVSDDLFLREINNFAFAANRDLGLRSTRFTTSRTGVVKRWTRGLTLVEGDYYQDLIDPQSLALQRLPRLEGEHGVPLLGDRVVARLAGEATHFWREEGYQGLRGDLAPELFLPFSLGRFVQASVTGRVRETAYHLTDRRQVAFVVPNDPFVTLDPDFDRFRVAPEMPRLERDRTRELAEVHARIGTEVGRVFSFGRLGIDKLKHTIEPEAQYLYIPQVGRPIFDDFRLPTCAEVQARGITPERGENCEATLFSEGFLFDERDAINRRNFVSWGVTTRILARGAALPARVPPGGPAAALPARPVPGPPAPADGTDPGDGPEAPGDAEARGGEEALGAEAAAEPGEDGDDAADGDEADGDDLEVEAVPAGLSRDAIPTFVGPPAPPPGRAAPLVPASRELLRASVLHGYDVSRTLVGDSHASDVDLGLRLTPLSWLGMSYNATASVEDSAIRGMAVGAFVREPWWTPSALARYQTASSVALSYRFIDENVNRLQSGDPTALLLNSPGVNEIDGAVYLRLGNYVGFTFLSRYNLNSTPEIGPHFLERDYLLRLISRCNCWILDAGFSDKFNPDERIFRVQFTLVGLGSFGRSPGTQDYVRFAPLTGLGSRRSAYGGWN